MAATAEMTRPASSDATINLERRLRLVGGIREFGLVGLLVLVVIGVTLRTPLFLSQDNVEQILISVSLIAMVAVGEAAVVITRNVDLSVGSLVGLTAFLTGDVLKYHYVGLEGAVLLALITGVMLGAFNGLLVAVVRVPAIVATLGTLFIYRGIDFVVAGGQRVSAQDLPANYLALSTGTVVGLPILVVTAITVAIVAGLLMRYTVTGRWLYALGSNPLAATLVGIPSRRLVFLVFVVSGMLCAITGVLWGSRFGTVDAFAASGLELEIIAAVVIGGVNIFGGSGSVLGAVLGALFLGTVGNGLNSMRLSPFWLQTIYGAVILVAVTADAAIRRYLTGLSQGARIR